MQIAPSQVVVQLASVSFGSAGLPVFSISTSASPAGQPGGVQISALARAMAGVAPVGATPQLNLAVQYVGSFGTGSSLSFTPFSPAAAAADQYAIIDSDQGEAVRGAAVEEAVPAEAEPNATGNASPEPSPAPAAIAAPQGVASSAYVATAAVAAAPAAAPSVNVSV